MDINLTINLHGLDTHQLLFDVLEHVQGLTVQGERFMALADSTKALLQQIQVKVNTIGTQLSDATTGIRSDISALKTAVASGQTSPREVDDALTGLLNSLDQVAQATDALTALDLENPAASPDPAGASTGTT